LIHHSILFSEFCFGRSYVRPSSFSLLLIVVFLRGFRAWSAGERFRSRWCSVGVGGCTRRWWRAAGAGRFRELGNVRGLCRSTRRTARSGRVPRVARGPGRSHKGPLDVVGLKQGARGEGDPDGEATQQAREGAAQRAAHQDVAAHGVPVDPARGRHSDRDLCPWYVTVPARVHELVCIFILF
jgi:hypothetical protein